MSTPHHTWLVGTFKNEAIELRYEENVRRLKSELFGVFCIWDPVFCSPFCLEETLETFLSFPQGLQA